MKVWTGDRYRELTCTCEAEALRAAGHSVVDDDAPDPEPQPEPQAAPEPQPEPQAAPEPQQEMTSGEPDRMGRRQRNRP